VGAPVPPFADHGQIWYARVGPCMVYYFRFCMMKKLSKTYDENASQLIKYPSLYSKSRLLNWCWIEWRCQNFDWKLTKSRLCSCSRNMAKIVWNLAKSQNLNLLNTSSATTRNHAMQYVSWVLSTCCECKNGAQDHHSLFRGDLPPTSVLDIAYQYTQLQEDRHRRWTVRQPC